MMKTIARIAVHGFRLHRLAQHWPHRSPKGKGMHILNMHVDAKWSSQSYYSIITLLSPSACVFFCPSPEQEKEFSQPWSSARSKCPKMITRIEVKPPKDAPKRLFCHLCFSKSAICDVTKEHSGLNILSSRGFSSINVVVLHWTWVTIWKL